MTPPPTLAILAIGDELTSGERVDTNSAWIASKAAAMGVRTVEHRTVGDDQPRIARAMRDLAAQSTLLITTGGLGPTLDDLTRPALAEVLGSPLVEDPEALAALRKWYTGRSTPMPEANRVQALRPESARRLENPHGTAPGLAATLGQARIFCLPGPPREMCPMFDRFVTPALQAAPQMRVHVRIVPTFGLGESTVADLLGDLMNRERNPVVGTTASGGIVTCRIRYTGPAADADRLLEESIADIRGRLGPAVLSGHDPRDDGLALVRSVSDLLRQRGQTVATVESCTGGLLGEMITRLPGSSDVFAGGLLTYTDALKARLAGVDPSLIEQHGAVSREVALAMAAGGLERTGADHALAITGIAGPGGGSEAKPVGTVWIARACTKSEPEARRFRFQGGRDWVRQWSAMNALGMLRLSLLEAHCSLLGES
ncbi:MAG: competence/damage-inducible protein A [Phycisphaerales bacterium]|nr:competence/damage-inducible protein A [Planctomycetota bacterium]MCH8507604.1 competence/damage-inducible protein A [Phycisphaerales bacterium]